MLGEEAPQGPQPFFQGDYPWSWVLHRILKGCSSSGLPVLSLALAFPGIQLTTDTYRGPTKWQAPSLIPRKDLQVPVRQDRTTGKSKKMWESKEASLPWNRLCPSYWVKNKRQTNKKTTTDIAKTASRANAGSKDMAKMLKDTNEPCLPRTRTIVTLSFTILALLSHACIYAVNLIKKPPYIFKRKVFKKKWVNQLIRFYLDFEFCLNFVINYFCCGM